MPTPHFCSSQLAVHSACPAAALPLPATWRAVVPGRRVMTRSQMMCIAQLPTGPLGLTTSLYDGMHLPATANVWSCVVLSRRCR